MRKKRKEMKVYSYNAGLSGIRSTTFEIEGRKKKIKVLRGNL